MTKTRYPGVTRLPDGRFKIVATVTCPQTGKKLFRRQTLPSGFSLQDAVVARAQAITALTEEASRRPVAASRPVTVAGGTVADYCERWLELRSPGLKASVRKHYVDVLSAHVLPVLGERRVGDLTRADVAEWVVWAEARRQRSGRAYAQATLEGWYRVLGTLLRDAAADARISDPTLRVRGPRGGVRRVRELQTLTGEQLGRLLRAVRESFAEWFPEVYVLAMTGMRPGELYALLWEDVDFDQSRIQVRRAVWHGVVGETKTGSPRIVAMPEPMAEILRRHRLELVRSQHRGLASGLVFPSDTGGHRHPSSLRKTLCLAAGMAELPIKVSPQVLRRTFNTLLLEAGVHEVVLRAQMGHTSRAMTERYAGIHIERKLDAVRALEAMTRPGGDGGARLELTSREVQVQE